MIQTIKPDERGRVSLLQQLKMIGWNPGDAVKIDFIEVIESDLNMVTAARKEIDKTTKYIEEYLKLKNGMCVHEIILGHMVSANHDIDKNGVCIKCGLMVK